MVAPRSLSSKAVEKACKNLVGSLYFWGPRTVIGRSRIWVVVQGRMRICKVLNSGPNLFKCASGLWRLESGMANNGQ